MTIEVQVWEGDGFSPEDREKLRMVMRSKAFLKASFMPPIGTLSSGHLSRSTFPMVKRLIQNASISRDFDSSTGP